jgi:hypothetical protein
MSKNKANKSHSKKINRKPSAPKKVKAKKALPVAKGKPGRKPEEKTAFDKTTMVRMFKTDYASFEACAAKLAEGTGSSVSVGAFLRLAGRKLVEAMA